MSLLKLFPDPNQPPLLADFDVQETSFSFDILGRYVCNNYDEVKASIDNGGYPFDVVIIGAGMFGAYCAEKIFRAGKKNALRILLIDAGDLVLPSHIQNLPQKLGGKVGGVDFLRNRDDGKTQNVIWGMPWLSNEGFPGLAYCVGGRSLFWGGWSPRLTDEDLANWPIEIKNYLADKPLPNKGEYTLTEEEIGVKPSTDYIVHASAFTALNTAFTNAQPSIPAITEVAEAPLAVQGASPGPGLFPFDKFSSCPFLIDAIREDIANNNGYGDVSRRMFLLPKTQVLKLNKTGNAVTSIDVSTNGQLKKIFLSPGCSVVLANGTIEATRIALDSLGIGSTQFGSPRVGNLMGHLRSNITVRIKRSALGLPAITPATELETTAHIIRGKAFGRRFHLQVTAASVFGNDPEKNMWSMVPDIELQKNMIANQDPDWLVITFRGIGEMEDQRSLNPDPSKSWIDLSSETDRWTNRRAYVNLVKTNNDQNLWNEMDKTAFDLAIAIAGNSANIQYWNGSTWQNQQLQPDANGKKFWQDFLGTTHHEAGTLFMGAPGSSVTDTNGKFHNVDNVYVAGPAIFPTLGSANPSLTALSLVRKTVNEIVAKTTPVPDAGFTPLSLSPNDWKMVAAPGTSPSVKNYGNLLETANGYGLYWYIKEQFSNFILKLDWRVGRRDDNSGVYIRIPDPGTPNPLQAADNLGHEIQIDERGFNSQTNTEGDWFKINGAIYDLQPPSHLASNPVGTWNTYMIEANGNQIKVILNGQLVNTYQSNRQTSGFIALQAHHYTSRVQFRNLQIKKLP